MDNEEMRNAFGRATNIMTAQRCPTCHHHQEPELINVTVFEDETPRWVIGWQCHNTYLHKQINKRNQQ